LVADVTVTWVQSDRFVAAGTGEQSGVLDAPAGRDAWQGFKRCSRRLGTLRSPGPLLVPDPSVFLPALYE
jgi:hypothetical protein